MMYRVSSNQKGVPKGYTRFEFDIVVLGSRKRKTITCRKSAVNSLFRKWEKQIFDTKDGNFSFFEKLDAFLEYAKSTESEDEIRHKSLVVLLLKKCFKDMRLHEFEAYHIDDFIAWRRKNPMRKHMKTVSNATIKRNLAAVSKFFNWCIKRRYYKAVNPVYGVILKN